MAPRVAQVGPWSTNFDRNLRATDYGEPRLPFRFHVRPVHDETCYTNDEDGFHKFSRLPVELQRHIIAFCDTATLFQLMHTSCSTREEAKKLFWSDSRSRFIIDGQWLQAGGHPRHANYDYEALTHMQYIEVDFSHYGSEFIMEWRDGGYWSDIREGEEQRAVFQRAVFWRTLRRLFPRVTDVVLDETNPPRRREEPPPQKPTQLAIGSPDSISVSVQQLRSLNDTWYAPETRYLWQQNCGDASSPTWDLVETSWEPRRIMPPIKKHSGPVGLYQKYDHDDMDLKELNHARDLHAVRATAAYYSHIAQTPCVCLWPACGLQFEHPEDWIAHYLDASLRRLDHEGTVPPPPDASIRATFLRHDMMLAQRRHQLSHDMASMQAAWGAPDSPERRLITRGFLEQLRGDVLYKGDVEPEESEIWFRYQRDMNGEEHPLIY